MSKYMELHDIVSTYNGVARSTDFNIGGIRNDELAHFCTEGKIYRVRKGIYSAVPVDELSSERLLAVMLPEAIVCVESALYYYGYSDHVPNEWNVAVPRTFSRSRFKQDCLFLKPYYIQESLFSLGQTSENINGVFLKIYDRERTICDCFKYRNKLDAETFNKSVIAYANDSKKNLANLSIYAKKMRVQKKLHNIMEVLLNG